MGYKLNRATIRVNNSRGLPAEYQEVEYIQSSGTQWIDTGVYADQNTVVETKWNLVQYNSNINYDKLYGTYGSNGTNCFMFQSNRPDNYKIRAVNYINANMTYNIDSLSAISTGTDYTTIHSNTEFKINGVSQGSSSASTYTTPTTITIFGLHNGNSVIQNVYMKLYYFQIYDGATLVRDFVPCYRIADDVIGMYDLVNDVFYTNSGTGTFTKGADVPSMIEKQIRPQVQPSGYEISYDLRDGTLAGLEAAGFTGISTNGGYAFDSNGLYQTSSSNDRGTSVYKTIDLTQAKKITIQSLGYWERGSWTNDKYVGILTTQNTKPSLRGQIRLNTNTGSKEGGIEYYNASGTMILSSLTQQDRYSGDTTMTLVIDLENKVIDYNTSGTNVASRTLSITDAIVAEIRSMQFIYLGWNRGYHSFDANERLKEVYIKIE